jgi:hypothetical protein
MKSLLLLALTLSAASRAAIGEADLSVGAGASGTLINGIPSLQVGPKVGVGYTGNIFQLPLGFRLSGQYDLFVVNTPEVNVDGFLWHRNGWFEPYGGLGLTMFIQPNPSFFLHLFGGIEGRIGNVVGAFFELSPGLLIDKGGAVFWMGANVGARFHISLEPH